MKKFFSTALFLLFIVTVEAQDLNANWKTDLQSTLNKFLECSVKTEKDAACTNYIGESLKIIYRVDDFYSKSKGRYMTSSEITEFLKGSGQWTVLGQSYDQKVLSQASDRANSKKAVVAVYSNAAGVGHVVVITPGEMASSGSWGLKVPNAASFFSIEPHKSFVDKSLSFAFSKHMLVDTKIYARNY